MNLFWETRKLTQAREDHLTAFLAAALEIDSSFRRAYELRVLIPLADGLMPAIAEVQTQASFANKSCRPDLLLRLTDGRVVVCEHKIEAPETPRQEVDGEMRLQLERYLDLPVSAVAYFRANLAAPASGNLDHPRYLRPQNAPHYLWRDLFEPLTAGRHEITQWLREGFEKLGFTPPIPHVGKLRPDDTDEVRRNQENFGKLWDRTKNYARERWHIKTGRRCELYLHPLTYALVDRIYVSPLAQDGTLLRIRAVTDAERLTAVRERLRYTNERLPVVSELRECKDSGGLPSIDLLAPLRLVLSSDAEANDHAARLFDQVVPILEAVRADA